MVNLNVPGAVTVVPTYDFGRVIDPTIVTRVDPRTISSVRPVLNPLTVDQLRTVAFQTREGRQRIDVPRQVVQRLDTPVVASTIIAPRFRQDLARAMRVERVDDHGKNQKLQISDQRATAPAQTTQPGNIAVEQQRERQIADLSRQAARGDRNARQQLQDLRRQQATERASVQAQGQQVGQPVRPQDERQLDRQQQQAEREAARQQVIQSQQQQRAAAQQQMQAQREQRRNQAQQAQQTRNAPRPQTIKSQPPPRRPPEAAPQRPPQAQPQPNRVQSVPRAAPQAQPRSQNVRPPQAQPAKPSGSPGQSKPGKKKPGGE